MAFWGIEVKPGKPFTHFFDRVRGRLRVSQATLGIGYITQKSFVQCNVGNNSPVLLCALLPEKTESCTLDLEFEEADEVVFSVIGPRSVHLTGYYMGNGQHENLNDDTDSYGEDIANTETEESTRQSEEDEYDDSFIDDDDPNFSPPSPMSNGGDDNKLETRKGHRRLKKKYKLSESNNEDSFQLQKAGNCRNGAVIMESEDEDILPISSLCKTENTAQNTKLVENADKEKDQTGNERKDNDNFVNESTLNPEAVAADSEPERFAGPEIDVKPKSKRNRGTKEGKALEDSSVNNIQVLEEDKSETKQDDSKPKSIDPDQTLEDQQNQKPVNENGDDLRHAHLLLPRTEVSPEKGAKLKKKRKVRTKEEKTLEAYNADYSNAVKEDKDQQAAAEADKTWQDKSVRNGPDFKPANDKNLNPDADYFAGEEQSDEKNIKKKKKKKRSKTQENDEDVNNSVKLLPATETGISVMDVEGEQCGESSHVRTLSNGLMIEELKMGTDGKVATQGKKVSVHYVGKLMNGGHIFDSNVEGDPFKFRLGKQKVIEGWDTGIDGMRVGDKRRLTIPPLLGYGDKGDGENVPPNSWLVFDVELVAVR